MKIGVYFCNCGNGDGGNVSGGLPAEDLRARLEDEGLAFFERVDFACSDAGQDAMVAHLQEHRPDRVVIAACSPRDHESTFRGVLEKARMNPYFMQMVNVREQVAWVTPVPEQAAEKAAALLRAAIRRVRLHDALEPQEVDVSTSVLVIGGGPAGLKAAMSLAHADRDVILVEKGPILGGFPVRYEDVFPRNECGPCLLEPILGEVLHGEISKHIELHLLSEVTQVSGFFGNFEVKIRENPRYVSLDACVGCAECIGACPVSVPNPVNLGRTERKAMDFEFFGGLPNAPFVDPEACLRTAKGEDCTLCRDACPVEGAVLLDDSARLIEKKVGAVIVAVGASLYDLSNLPALGYGRLPDVCSSFEFERILASNGPTGGAIVTRDGAPVRRMAIIHCAGSLDATHKPYCSAVCCQAAFKFMHLVAHKSPETEIVAFHRSIVTPGKEAFATYRRVLRNPKSRFVDYRDPAEIAVDALPSGGLEVRVGTGDESAITPVDLVVLMPPIVPSAGARSLAETLDLGVDDHGFFEEMNGRTDATRSKVRGIYLAGTCQAPMDMQLAMTQGMAASAQALAELVEGRRLLIEPVTARVDDERCSGCRTCVPVCPYRAIGFDETKATATINPVLCAGCGTCVAACPSGSIRGNHFTTEQVFAEIEGVMA